MKTEKTRVLDNLTIFLALLVSLSGLVNGQDITVTPLNFPPRQWGLVNGPNMFFSPLNATYGIGTFSFSASNSLSAANQPWHAFDSNPTSSWTSPALYNANGLPTCYNGTTSMTVGGVAYKGDWLQIRAPSAIRLTSFAMSLPAFASTRAPTDFMLVGSNDTITWEAILSLTSATETRQVLINNYALDYNITTSKSYTTYRLLITCAKKGTGNSVNVIDLTFTGYEGASIRLSPGSNLS